MEAEILKVAGQIAGIAGLSVGVLLILFREVIRKNIFPNLTKEQGYRLLRLIIMLVWSLALVGITAWAYTSLQEQKKNSQPESVNEDSFSRLRGEVIDKASRAPIAGAAITVKELSIDTVLTTTTTNDGGFYFGKIPGKFGDRARVYVEKTGYKGLNEYIALPGPIKFELEENK